VRAGAHGLERLKGAASVDLVSAVANPLVGLAKHPRVARRRSGDAADPFVPPMVIHDATQSFDEIACAARSVLPGARCRRRLFFRYTLEWSRPSAAPAGRMAA
jgi:hypothetical protein